jgi:hypothetical protein
MMRTASTAGEWWVLLVTEGLSITLPPGVYADEQTGEREAERWAWLLASANAVPIDRPFPGRWEVGSNSIRLVHAFLAEEYSGEIWVGTHWTRHGLPDPEAELFTDGDEARSWALETPPGGLMLSRTETPWMVGALFRVHSGEEESVVALAKVIT